MARTKTRVLQHMMEDDSIRIIRDTLPSHWVVRDYKPDYGIDLAVEIFELTDAAQAKATTLGEIVFLQVKSTKKVTSTTARVCERYNVELAPLSKGTSSGSDAEIEVIGLELETSELLTVQAMGSCIPVLLFLVELSTRKIYFVCLNDLVEKVILPADPAFAAKRSKVIHIPLSNCITAEAPLSVQPVATYAKRPKLYAAFEKFAYQLHHVEEALLIHDMCSTAAQRKEAALRMFELTKHFLRIILRYDFWTRMPEWAAIPITHPELCRLDAVLRHSGSEEGETAIRAYLLEQPMHARLPSHVESMTFEEAEETLCSEITSIWRRLDNLSRIYEELIREVHLPTKLADSLVRYV